MPSKSVYELPKSCLECLLALWVSGHDAKDRERTQPILANGDWFCFGDKKYCLTDRRLKELETWGCLEFIDDKTLIITEAANSLGVQTFAELYMK